MYDFKQYIKESANSKHGITKTRNKEGQTVFDFVLNGSVIGKLKSSKRQVSVGRRSTTKTIYDFTWELEGLRKAFDDKTISTMGANSDFDNQYATAIRNPSDLDYMVDRYLKKNSA